MVPSGVTATAVGLFPTGIVAPTVLVAVQITETVDLLHNRYAASSSML
jgi:hypothetical protein